MSDNKETENQNPKTLRSRVISVLPWAVVSSSLYQSYQRDFEGVSDSAIKNVGNFLTSAGAGYTAVGAAAIPTVGLSGWAGYKGGGAVAKKIGMNDAGQKKAKAVGAQVGAIAGLVLTAVFAGSVYETTRNTLTGERGELKREAYSLSSVPYDVPEIKGF